MNYPVVLRVGPTTKNKNSSNNTHLIFNSSSSRHLLVWPAITKETFLFTKIYTVSHQTPVQKGGYKRGYKVLQSDSYLLTHTMAQSPSWEANWFAASREFPRISRNPKVHYRTYKRPPPVSILGQLNPVHIPTSHLLEIHPNIMHPPTPRSPQWSPSLRFPHQDPIHTGFSCFPCA